MMHSHHWRIDEPNGPTSDGRCTDCGATKTFHNGDCFAQGMSAPTERDFGSRRMMQISLAGARDRRFGGRWEAGL